MTDWFRKSLVASCLLGLALFQACAYDHGDLKRLVDQSGRDFRRDPSRVYTDVSLKQIISRPSNYKYIDVRFRAVMNKVGEQVFMPFWTHFDPEYYIAFSVWPEDASMYDPKIRAASYPFMYVAKVNPTVRDLLATSRFSVVEFSGRVMNDFDQKAWIAVDRIHVVSDSAYTEEGLTHYSLAADARSQKKIAPLIHHLEAALQGIWTTDSRLAIHLELAKLYEDRGDFEKALNHFELAIENDPENAVALAGVERVEAAIEAKAAAAAAAANK